MSAGWAGGLWIAVSAVLLVTVCTVLARAIGRDRAERFFVALAAGALQLGGIATALSLVRGLTAGAFLAVQVVLLAAVVWAVRTARRGRARTQGGLQEGVRSLGALGALVAGAVLVLVLLSLADQLVTPIDGFDDRMYHASRAAYWLEHRSVFPYVTHNDRQVALPFGSDLVFFWGLLLGGSETAGRLAIWCGAPLAFAGLFFLLRETQVGTRAAALGVLLFAATPAVVSAARGLNPEMWSAAFAVGVAWAALRLHLTEAADETLALLAGLLLAFATNVRTTGIVLLVGVALVALRKGPAFRRRLTFLVGGGAGRPSPERARR